MSHVQTPAAPARTRVLLISALALAGLMAASLALAPAAEAQKRGLNIKVMTRNVYLGADLSPALEAASIGEAIDGAGEIYNEIERTDFPARAKPLAREIKRAKPHLVGLQEVALWREQIPSDGGSPGTTGLGTDATDVKYNFLKRLNQELKRQGVRYKIVGVQREFEGELPADVDGDDSTGSGPLAAFGADVDARLTMRDVILARRGVKTKRLRKQNFDARFTADVGGVPVEALRGWLSVHATVIRGGGGKNAGIAAKRPRKAKFRFVNTHLEAFGDPSIREAQARELFEKGGPLRSNKQVILVGDLNSGLAGRHKVFGDDRLAFQALKQFGMEDRGAVQSCCYPSALDDPSFTFDHTVDHVMVRPKVKGLRAFVTGNDASQMTPSGLWPSDHGGVVSKLRLQNIRVK